MQILIISGLLITGCFAAIITWKVSPHFLSRSDLYRHSRFGIIKKKLIWALSAFLIPVIIYGLLYLNFSKKNKEVVVDSKAAVILKPYKAKKPVRLERRLPVIDSVPIKAIVRESNYDSTERMEENIDSIGFR